MPRKLWQAYIRSTANRTRRANELVRRIKAIFLLSYASNSTHAVVRLPPSEPPNQVRSTQLIDSSALSNPTAPSNPRAHSTLITLPIVSISDPIQPCLPPKRKASPPLPLVLVLNTIRQLQRASPPATIATERTPNQRFLKTPTCQKICGTPCDDTFLKIRPRSLGNH